jgi:hypothetical protein
MHPKLPTSMPDYGAAPAGGRASERAPGNGRGAYPERSRDARLLLLAICLLTVGNHFGRHFISSLGPLVMRRLRISRSQYGLIFSVQELPSVVLPLASGFFISALRLQYGPVAVLLTSVLCLGQLITAVAVQAASYRAVVFG